MSTNITLSQALATTMPTLNTHLKSINSGGCGLVAHSLYEALKSHGIESRIVVDPDGNEGAINDAALAAIAGDYYMAPVNHIVVMLEDGALIDSNGTPGPFWEFDTNDPMLPENLEGLLEVDVWNNRFRSANKGVDVESLVPVLVQQAVNEALTMVATFKE